MLTPVVVILQFIWNVLSGLYHSLSNATIHTWTQEAEMTSSPEPQPKKITTSSAPRAIKWALTVLVISAVAAFFILPLNSCIEGCDCDEEIVDAIVKYGEPDEENRSLEDKQYTAEYIFYDAEVKKTFVWGKDVDVCCLETTDIYVLEDEDEEDTDDDNGDETDGGDDGDGGDDEGGGDDGDGNDDNIAPVADDASFEILNGQKLAFVLSGSDPDGDDEDLSFEIQDTVIHGELTCDSQGECEYEPTSDDETDTFTFAVTDSEGAESEPATVTITIGNPDLNPVAEAQVAEAQPGEEIVIELKGIDRSPDSEMVVQDVMALGVSVLREGLTYYLETLPEQGEITYPAGVADDDLPYQLSDRFVEYTAPDAFTETDSFEFSVSDTDGDVQNRSAAKTVTIQPVE
jgi:hypothetical protein